MEREQFGNGALKPLLGSRSDHFFLKETGNQQEAGPAPDLRGDGGHLISCDCGRQTGILALNVSYDGGGGESINPGCLGAL